MVGAVPREDQPVRRLHTQPGGDRWRSWALCKCVLERIVWVSVP